MKIPKSPTWTTKDGQCLLLPGMETRHLENIVAMIRRHVRRELDRAAFSALAYASSAPDGAAMAAEMEADHMIDIACTPDKLEDYIRGHWPIYNEIMRELNNRKGRRILLPGGA